ncbi:MAG: zinc ribbon domain-containing protein [Syntrophobacteraceae bacterium]|nr:zinc ribbon domain-containing protein [Desulfobacteraceae bacterium]
MFFFIGGIQPKTVTLDETPRLCPVCGLAQARLKRIDHYLSVFFIPLFSVRKGEPVVLCERCGAASPPDPEGRPPGAVTVVPLCPGCGHAVEPSFRYCPHCGNRI